MTGVRAQKTATGWEILCPGCKRLHQLSADTWRMTGTPTTPTFDPGFLDEREPRCRFRVSLGRIYFFEDSAHPLAGRGVDLPEVPEAAAGLPGDGIHDVGTPYAGGFGPGTG